MADKPKHLDDAFRDVCDELAELFVKKHKDYGKQNILDIEELGIAIRETEKISRIKNLLLSQNNPANEPLEDSWKDIAVYAIIALLYRRGLFRELEMEDY